MRTLLVSVTIFWVHEVLSAHNTYARQLYRLRGARKFLISKEKFHDEDKLKATIEKVTGGTVTVQRVTEGQDLKRNHADDLISSVRKHNEAMWEVERIILRREMASDQGKLDKEKKAKLAEAFQQQL